MKIMDEEDDDDIYCENGHPCMWEDCGTCGGEGGRYPYEDHPFEYDPDGWEDCDMCDGKGGWWLCLERCGAEAVLT